MPPVVSNVRLTNSLLGFLIDSARVGPRSRRGVLSTIMEPLKIDPVPLGASQIPTHKPSRRCVASDYFFPCATRRDTRHERDTTHDEHHGPAMPTAHSLHRRANTRGRVRGRTFVPGRRRRCLVGGAFRTFRNYPKCPNQPKIRDVFPRLGKLRSGKNAIPSFQNVLVAFVRVDGAERKSETPTRQARTLFLIRTFLNVLGLVT